MQRLAEAAREHAAATRRRHVQEAADFQPEPSLFPALRYLYEACVVPLGGGRCPLCDKRLLPSDPSKLPKVPKAMQVHNVHSVRSARCASEMCPRPRARSNAGL
jgi:hypothetical protein